MTTDKGHYEKTSGASDTYLKVFLEKFVAFSPSKTISLVEDIQQLRPSISQGNTLIVVTPNLTKKLATELVDLKMTNIRPMVFVITTSDEASATYQDQLDLMQKLEAESIPFIKVAL